MPKIPKKTLDKEIKKIAREVITELPASCFSQQDMYQVLRYQYLLLSHSITYSLGDETSERVISNLPDWLESSLDRWGQVILAEWALIRYSWGELRDFCSKKKVEMPFDSRESFMSHLLNSDAENLLNKGSNGTINSRWRDSGLIVEAFNNPRKFSQLPSKILVIQGAFTWRDVLHHVANKSKRTAVRDRYKNWMTCSARLAESHNRLLSQQNKKKPVVLTI